MYTIILNNHNTAHTEYRKVVINTQSHSLSVYKELSSLDWFLLCLGLNKIDYRYSRVRYLGVRNILQLNTCNTSISNKYCQLMSSYFNVSVTKRTHVTSRDQFGFQYGKWNQGNWGWLRNLSAHKKSCVYRSLSWVSVCFDSNLKALAFF